MLPEIKNRMVDWKGHDRSADWEWFSSWWFDYGAMLDIQKTIFGVSLSKILVLYSCVVWESLKSLVSLHRWFNFSIYITLTNSTNIVEDKDTQPGIASYNFAVFFSFEVSWLLYMSMTSSFLIWCDVVMKISIVMRL